MRATAAATAPSRASGVRQRARALSSAGVSTARRSHGSVVSRGSSCGVVATDGQDAGAHRGRRIDRRDGQAQLDRGIHQLGHLGAQLLRLGHEGLELRLLGLGQCAQRVGAGGGHQLVAIGHDATPSSSRRRIMPSRRRVFTVPIGTLSICETSLWL